MTRPLLPYIPNGYNGSHDFEDPRRERWLELLEANSKQKPYPYKPKSRWGEKMPSYPAWVSFPPRKP